MNETTKGNHHNLRRSILPFIKDGDLVKTFTSDTAMGLRDLIIKQEKEGFSFVTDGLDHCDCCGKFVFYFVKK